MSETRYAKFPLDCAALKAANEAVWTAHPNLNRRKLTMASDESETSYRKAWMDAYIKAGGKVQRTKPKLKPGDLPTTCQPAAPAPTPEQLFERTRNRRQKNLDVTRKNLDYWEKRIPRLKSALGVAEALAWRNANRRWVAQDEKELQLFEDDKNRYGAEEALRRADLRRTPTTEEDRRSREETQQREVIADLSKAAQEARQKEAAANSPEDKKKFAEAAKALEDDVKTMEEDLHKFLQQTKPKE